MGEGFDAFGSKSFGVKVVNLDAEDLLALEAQYHSQRFHQIDDLLGALLKRRLLGQSLVACPSRRRGNATVIVEGIDAEQRAFLHESFALARQNSRGAWYLPVKGYFFIDRLNHPIGLRADADQTCSEGIYVPLSTSADAVFIWALLEPLLERIFRPLELPRLLEGDDLTQAYCDDAWAEAAEYLRAVGFDVDEDLAVMRRSSRRHGLPQSDRIRAGQLLLEKFASQVNSSTASRHRAVCLAALIRQYYDKKKRGEVTSRQVLRSIALKRTLSGFFGGDWLAFLDYLGESPSSEEKITTALPKVRGLLGAGQRPADVAIALGVPVEEVERVLTTYEAETRSPIEQRVGALRRYWTIFDEVHASQKRDMVRARGLVNGRREIWSYMTGEHTAGLYRSMVPAELTEEIDRLWGTIMLGERIVSARFPHMTMARALGPALNLWEGCALAVLSECRTTVAGLKEYRQEFAALDELGCPVDSQFFDDLRQAGRRFEALADTITRHRRAWSEQYLDAYLNARWKSEINTVAETYHRIIADKGRPPTRERTVSLSRDAADHWFGGEIGGLYAAFREKAPFRQTQNLIMPTNRVGFASSMLAALEKQTDHVADENDGPAQAGGDERNKNLKELAEASLGYIVVAEMHGHLPNLWDLGADTFARYSGVFSDDIDEAWAMYIKALETALGRRLPYLEQENAPGKSGTWERL